jgi:hypothetical protein
VWRFAPVAERNGKLLRDRVLIAGHEELRTEGSHYLEWYEAGRPTYSPRSFKNLRRVVQLVDGIDTQLSSVSVRSIQGQ